MWHHRISALSATAKENGSLWAITQKTQRSVSSQHQQLLYPDLLFQSSDKRTRDQPMPGGTEVQSLAPKHPEGTAEGEGSFPASTEVHTQCGHQPGTSSCHTTSCLVQQLLWGQAREPTSGWDTLGSLCGSWGAGKEGLHSHWPTWASPPMLLDLSPRPASLGWPHSSVVALLGCTMPASRHCWGTNQGQGVKPQHHHMDIVFGLHCQKGFFVDSSWSPCTTTRMPWSLSTSTLRLKAFCKLFFFIWNHLHCYNKVICMVLCCF